jgi:hypothetical protein
VPGCQNILHRLGGRNQPTLEEVIHFYAPGSRSEIQRAVERGLKRGEGWDLELTLLRTIGETIWVRSVGHR